jgi:hypothetical protein
MGCPVDPAALTGCRLDGSATGVIGTETGTVDGAEDAPVLKGMRLALRSNEGVSLGVSEG